MMGSPSDAIKGAVSGTGFLVGLIMVLLGLGVFALYAFRRYKKYVLHIYIFIYTILNEYRMNTDSNDSNTDLCVAYRFVLFD